MVANTLKRAEGCVTHDEHEQQPADCTSDYIVQINQKQEEEDYSSHSDYHCSRPICPRST